MSESESEEASPSSRNDKSQGSALPHGAFASRAQGSRLNESFHASTQDLNGDGAQTYFTPQPNAFSHPPPSLTMGGERGPDPRLAAKFSRNHAPHAPHADFQTSRFGLPKTARTPSHQPDHDEALRASLSTLLSCAAAARGLPESRGVQSDTMPRQSDPRSRRIEPSTLRMVPGSEMTSQKSSASSRHRQRSSSESSGSSQKKGKRKANKSTSRDIRSPKRLRRDGMEEAISPTLLTWVVSASVLVLVGAIGFSAGYTLGSEASRTRIPRGVVQGEGCSTQASKSGLGLRRRIWSSAARAVSA